MQQFYTWTVILCYHLTLLTALILDPAAISISTISTLPHCEAQCREVHPSYTSTVFTITCIIILTSFCMTLTFAPENFHHFSVVPVCSSMKLKWSPPILEWINKLHILTWFCLTWITALIFALNWIKVSATSALPLCAASCRGVHPT